MSLKPKSHQIILLFLSGEMIKLKKDFPAFLIQPSLYFHYWIDLFNIIMKAVI